MNLLLITLRVLFSVILSNSLAIIFTQSSILIILLVVTQTFLVCISIKLLINTRWYSFILFLVFVGGLLVLFIYIVRLSPNSQFTVRNLIIIIYSSIVIGTLLTNSLLLENVKIVNIKFINLNNYSLLIKLYSNSSTWSTFIIISYLLLVLIVVVEIILIDRRTMKKLLIK